MIASASVFCLHHSHTWGREFSACDDEPAHLRAIPVDVVDTSERSGRQDWLLQTGRF
jgi:hypothetical protein